MVENNARALAIIAKAFVTLEEYAKGYASMHASEMEICQIRDQRAIPAQLDLLNEAYDALKSCSHPEDIALWDSHVELAKAIVS